MLGSKSADLVLVDKEENPFIIIDLAIPVEVKLLDKETEKIKTEKYQNLQR